MKFFKFIIILITVALFFIFTSACDGEDGETKDAVVEEFTGLEFEGLNLVWQNNRWEYVDPNDGTVAGFWNEEKERFELTANELRGEWKGLFVDFHDSEVETKEDEFWDKEKWETGEIKIPIPFELTKGGVIEQKKSSLSLTTIIAGNFDFLVVRDLPPGTVFSAPFSVNGKRSYGLPLSKDEPCSLSLIRDSVGISIVFKQAEQWIAKGNPYNVKLDIEQGGPFTNKDKISLGMPLLAIDKKDNLNESYLTKFNSNLSGDYQLLLMSEAISGNSRLPISFSLSKNLLTDEKGRFIYFKAELVSILEKEAVSIDDEENSNKQVITDIDFPIKIKTLVLNYDPIIPSQGNKRLHQVCGWNDPRELIQSYIDDIYQCSGGNVIYEVVDWIDINDTIPFIDGFKYSPEEYVDCFNKACSERWDYWSWEGWHPNDAGTADHNWIITSNNLIEKVNNNEIDEVFVFAGTLTGLYESLMVGPNPIWCNSAPMIIPELNKNFLIMGFNYERDVGCMLENFGHRVESILSYEFNSNDIKGINYWEKFTLYDKIAPGEAGCGNVHFAPNSESDYDWGNSRYVYSTSDDWLNYPNLTGEKREVNCSEWGNGDMRLHHIWWLSHIPKADGLDSNGMLNNWWGYFSKYYKGY